MSVFATSGSLQRPFASQSGEQVVTPLSASAALASPTAASESGFSNIPGTPDTENDRSRHGSAAISPNGDGERAKPKQKRNKPTLSCEECVERKTKVCRESDSMYNDSD